MNFSNLKMYFWELMLLFANSVPYAENSEYEELHKQITADGAEH